MYTMFVSSEEKE